MSMVKRDSCLKLATTLKQTEMGERDEYCCRQNGFGDHEVTTQISTVLFTTIPLYNCRFTSVNIVLKVECTILTNPFNQPAQV